MTCENDHITPDPIGKGTDPDYPTDQRLVWWCLAAPILAVIVAVARAVRSGWVPRNDRVFVQLKALDVFGPSTPLVGMPSTLSASMDGTAHHLGPGQFWILAVPLRVVSAVTNSSASLTIAAATVTVGALVVVAWCLKHLGCSLYEGLMACGFISVACWQATTQVAVSPWNPDFAFIMFVTATTVGIAMSLRESTLGAAAVFVVLASLAAQAHLSFVMPTLALVVVTFVHSFRPARADRRRWLLVIGAVAGVVWSGPILDVVGNGGGNIATLASATGAPGAGFVAAFDRFAHSLAPWRLGLQQPRDGGLFMFAASWADRIFGLTMIAGVAAVIALGGRARRLAVTTLCLIVATIVGAAISPVNLGTSFAAHVQRVWIVPTLLVWATMIVGLIRVVHTRFASFLSRPERSLGATGAVAAVALVMSAVWSSYQGGTMDPQCSDAVGSLASVVADSAQDGDIFDSAAISFVGLGPAQDIATGLFGELTRQGIALRLIAETDPEAIDDHHFAPTTRPAGLATITISPVPPTAPTDAPVATASCQTATDFAEVWVWRQQSG